MCRSIGFDTDGRWLPGDSGILCGKASAPKHSKYITIGNGSAVASARLSNCRIFKAPNFQLADFLSNQRHGLLGRAR
jgi:hypothetical protein